MRTGAIEQNIVRLLLAGDVPSSSWMLVALMIILTGTLTVLRIRAHGAVVVAILRTTPPGTEVTAEWKRFSRSINVTTAATELAQVKSERGRCQCKAICDGVEEVSTCD